MSSPKPITLSLPTLVVLLLLSLIPFSVVGQDGDKKTIKSDDNASKQQEPESLKIVIADEPKTIDPTTTVYPPLAKKVTVKFDETSIREVVVWLRKEAGVTVLLDKADLADANILLSEPVTDQLNDEPLYLLLDRLSAISLGWYVAEDILHITTEVRAEEKLTTVPHNIGVFLDKKFEAEDLIQAIVSGTDSEKWEDGGGIGTHVLLGDVLFIRQSDAMHREVSGLLKALSNPARRTFVDDPIEHEKLRKKLTRKVSVEFSDVPLSEAIKTLSEKVNADIRIDRASFREARIREREPVSIRLTDQKLSSVLQALVAPLRLTWTLRNGLILVTTAKTSEGLLKTAVFDVRDLARDEEESFALADAITMQTNGQWEVQGGLGSIEFAKAGFMVVRNTEETLEEIYTLLNTYRQALKISKVRDRKKKEDPNEPLTRYYRMPSVIANDLAGMLPRLIEPESWKTGAKPKSIGTVVKVASTPVLIGANKAVVQNSVKKKLDGTGGLVMDYSVLIIHQKRSVHEKISELIFKIENGDLPKGGLGGGGLGGGGFGGGYFSTLESPKNRLGEKKPQD